MEPILSVDNVAKTYANGFTALKPVNLAIRKGEIFALLGPNGAGKTTLISIICGLTNRSSGDVRVGGHDNTHDYRAAREMIGLVPQELTVDSFETVLATVRFSRELFGRKPNDAYVEQILRDLSLWEKRDSRIMTLSGGMKRRVMIAKALAHEPRLLFLDEPTAGVDVELRRDMWQVVRRLRESGVTIFLTTHYIEEAQEMADRIGIIRGGELILVEEKAVLMEKLGRKELTVELQAPLAQLPAELAPFELTLSPDGQSLTYSYATGGERTGITALLRALESAGLRLHDIRTHQSTLEDIFIDLLRSRV